MKERYHPEYLEKLCKHLIEYAQAHAKPVAQDLFSGAIACCLDYREPSHTEGRCTSKGVREC
jgi:hypothetical protein